MKTDIDYQLTYFRKSKVKRQNILRTGYICRPIMIELIIFWFSIVGLTKQAI